MLLYVRLLCFRFRIQQCVHLFQWLPTFLFFRTSVVIFLIFFFSFILFARARACVRVCVLRATAGDRGEAWVLIKTGKRPFQFPQTFLLTNPGRYLYSYFTSLVCFIMPPPFSMGVHIVSPLSVRTSVPSVRPVHNTFGFRAISFERISVFGLEFYTQVYNHKM